MMLVDSKAVNHTALWKSFTDFGTTDPQVWLLQKLYGVLRLSEGHADQFTFEQGVRQGCIVSPLLFNACGEAIMRLFEERLKESLDQDAEKLLGLITSEYG